MIQLVTKKFQAGEHFDPKADPKEIMNSIFENCNVLNWSLKYEPVSSGEYRKIPVPGKRSVEAITPEGDRQVIDIYGRDRVAYQNTDMIGFFQGIANHYEGLELKSIGFNGFDIYASIKMPVVINPKKRGDITDVSLVIYEPRKNNEGMTFNTYYNRLICTNGMRDRIKVGNIVIDHRNQLDMVKVDQLINSAIKQTQKKEVLLEVLTETPMSVDEAHLLLIQEFGDPQKTLDDQPRIVQNCLALFDGQAEGSEMITAFQTAYGLLNAVTQHYRGSRSNQTNWLKVLNGKVGDKINEFERQLLTVSTRN